MSPTAEGQIRGQDHRAAFVALSNDLEELGSKDSASHDDHVAELAYHYAHGGNPDKAVEYCLRAVRKFVNVGSRTEALAQFESGLELLQDLPEGDRRAEIELDLRNAVFGAIGDIKGLASPEVERSIERALALCQRPRYQLGKELVGTLWNVLRSATPTQRLQSGGHNQRPNRSGGKARQYRASCGSAELVSLHEHGRGSL